MNGKTRWNIVGQVVMRPRGQYMTHSSEHLVLNYRKRSSYSLNSCDVRNNLLIAWVFEGSGTLERKAEQKLIHESSRCKEAQQVMNRSGNSYKENCERCTP